MLDVVLIPYELEEGMAEQKLIITNRTGTVGRNIYRLEGGFEEADAQGKRERGAVPVTLGKRILRTETAGLTTLSILDVSYRMPGTVGR